MGHPGWKLENHELSTQAEKIPKAFVKNERNIMREINQNNGN